MKKPLLNIYPDSLGSNLRDAADFLEREETADCFGGVYILPSLYHSDLDRGFSVIDYDLEESLADKQSLDSLGRNQGRELLLDLVANHASVNSPQFQDLLENGNQSVYQDFFLDWNRFWDGKGHLENDAIVPDSQWINGMFFRKPGLPYLMVEMPDGSRKPYWNTFYQQVWSENGKTRYLGQMDLDVRSEGVWDFYRETLQKLADYGASTVRLDAFAYASKTAGKSNFFNEPETWDMLERLSRIAQPLNIKFLPEIHSSYKEGYNARIAEKGYRIYDFFLPGLLLDAIFSCDAAPLAGWIHEIVEKGYDTVNMLGCHDGVPVLDLQGLLEEERIESIIDHCLANGGLIKNLHGQKNLYYQVNGTWYSLIAEDDGRLLQSRAVQMFMPGQPQIWYLDLFKGKNDLEAAKNGHKEINRTNLSLETIEEKLKDETVQKQLELLRLRSTHPAFEDGAEISSKAQGSRLEILWNHGPHFARLNTDFKTGQYTIEHS